MPQSIQTVGELYQQEDDRWRRMKKKEEEKEEKCDDRTIYFVVWHSRFWKKLNIVNIIRRLKKRFNLTYLCFSMAYRRYTNLCERFCGDLISKLNADNKSLDFMDHPCNYNKTSCVNGECAYKGKCRSTCIIYKAQCKICNEAYVGCTQDTFKSQMTHHFTDVTRLTSTLNQSYLPTTADKVTPLPNTLLNTFPKTQLHSNYGKTLI